MPEQNSYLYVSYARADTDRIRPLMDAIRWELKRRLVPVGLWVDYLSLSPGLQWDAAIEEALRQSIGVLALLSDSSVQSSFVRDELAYALDGERVIIPVLLDSDLKLPLMLHHLHALKLLEPRTPEKIADTAAKVVEVVEAYGGKKIRSAVKEAAAETPALAAEIAREIRAAGEPAAEQAFPTAVFVVHGHSTEAVARLEDYLSSVGVSAIVLSRQDESPQSLFQKFMSIAGKARFAIVLLGADDYGASCRQYDAPNVANLALQFRARQNVVLELGFFYGRLGWENVFVVYQEPGRVFPNFERPSDLDGVVFDSFSDAAWRKKLSAKLSAAGFKLDSSAVNG